MCFELDSVPPIRADRGRGCRPPRPGARERGRQPVCGVRRAARGAERRRRRDPAGRARAVPLLRGARSCASPSAALQLSPSTSTAARQASASARTTSSTRSIASRRRPEGVQADVRAGVDWLRDQGIGAIFTVGFCFGGRHSWLAAAGGHGLQGAVGFYGMPGGDSPSPIDSAGEMKAPILALQGGADQNITAEHNAEFDEALTAAGIEHEVVDVPGRPAQLLRPQAGGVRGRVRGRLEPHARVHRALPLAVATRTGAPRARSAERPGAPGRSRR